MEPAPRKTNSISHRLLFIILFVICLPIAIAGWLGYKSSTETIEQSAIETNQRIIEQTSDYLDLYISNLENSTYPFANNLQIQKFINARSLPPYSYYLLSETVEKDLFAPMIYGRTDIVGISLIAKNNMQINDYSRTKELLDMNDIRSRNEKLLSVMDDMDNFQILGSATVGSTPVLTVARKLHSSSSYNYEGLLIINLNLQQIAKICNNVSLGNFNVWISGRDGTIIYHPDGSRMGTAIDRRLAGHLQRSDAHYYRDERKPGNHVVIYRHSDVTNWTIAVDLPVDSIIANMIHLRNGLLIAGALIVVTALSITGGFSLSIARSLMSLRKLMSKVEQGDFQLRLTKARFRNDEIGSVFRGFYRMVGELNRLVTEVHSSKLKEQELIIKQKESALQSMQAHINPHFLYNSLEIINSHAIIENNLSISRMTTALAHMFRYNTGNAEHVVTLKEETAHIRSYLDIQAARFRHLQIEMRLDEAWLGRIRTVRLTLQPLVENAFIHGYRGKKPTYIGITGQPEPTHYSIRIADQGAGMSAAAAEAYNRIFCGEDEDNARNAVRLDRIGLLNVHERIRLTFGPPYGLRIVRTGPETGTEFEIRLPYNKQAKEESERCTE
ncbi:sensor histidine kinase [Paenibacillus dendritiformis]|uniref:cache domain-containing sensor histidine kinase n=1 Tax=Paenibacillus dendritiformis TaxID=130049 RepID=UPI0036671D4F